MSDINNEFGGPRMEGGLTTADVLRYISAGAGFLMILGGLYLSFVTFTEVRSLLHDPAPLKRWAALRDSIHPDQKVSQKPKPVPPTASKSPADPAPKTTRPRGEKEVRMLGGYAMLFMGLIFTWILAKIAGMFVIQGTTILLRTVNVPPGKK